MIDSNWLARLCCDYVKMVGGPDHAHGGYVRILLGMFIRVANIINNNVFIIIRAVMLPFVPVM